MLLMLALLAARPDPLSALASERDDFAGVTRYEARQVPSDDDSISAYFSRDDAGGVSPLSLVIFHSGHRQLFATTAMFLIDGARYVVYSHSTDAAHGCEWQHDSHRYGMYEFCEIEISISAPALLSALLSARTAKIRLVGAHLHDWSVPKRQLENIRKVHAGWASARGTALLAH